MTKEEGLEVIRRGNELADKLIEVLQKELGDEVPRSVMLYVAAKFTASILNVVRKQTDDDTIVKDFFGFMRTLMGDVVEKSEVQAFQNKIREAEQKMAEQRKKFEELDNDIESIDKRTNEYKRRIAENNIRLNAIKQGLNSIIHSSDDDKLN